MNEKILFDYYIRFKNLKSLAEIVSEIESVFMVIKNYNEDESIYILDFLIKKYSSDLKKIKNILKLDLEVVDEKGIYETKDENDLMADLELLRNCLILIAMTRCGMAKDLEDAINKVK